MRGGLRDHRARRRPAGDAVALGPRARRRSGCGTSTRTGTSSPRATRRPGGDPPRERPDRRPGPRRRSGVRDDERRPRAEPMSAGRTPGAAGVPTVRAGSRGAALVVAIMILLLAGIAAAALAELGRLAAARARLGRDGTRAWFLAEAGLADVVAAFEPATTFTAALGAEPARVDVGDGICIHLDRIRRPGRDAERSHDRSQRARASARRGDRSATDSSAAGGRHRPRRRAILAGGRSARRGCQRFDSRFPHRRPRLRHERTHARAQPPDVSASAWRCLQARCSPRSRPARSSGAARRRASRISTPPDLTPIRNAADATHYAGGAVGGVLGNRGVAGAHDRRRRCDRRRRRRGRGRALRRRRSARRRTSRLHRRGRGARRHHRRRAGGRSTSAAACGPRTRRRSPCAAAAGSAPASRHGDGRDASRRFPRAPG